MAEKQPAVHEMKDNASVTAAAMDALATRVRELEAELSERTAREERAGVQRRLDAALAAAGAVDVEAVGLLAMASLEGEAADERAIGRVVEELRARKPALFGVGSAGGNGGASGGGKRGGGASVGGGVGGGVRVGSMGALPPGIAGVMGGKGRRERELERLAAKVLESDDRRALAEYLRLRRGG